MDKRTLLLLFNLLLITMTLWAQKPDNSIRRLQPVDMLRVEQITGMLPDNPKGFGDPIEDRANWDKLYQSGKFKHLIKEADDISSVPFPQLTDEIYLNYFKGKDSETSKRFIMKRRMLLTKIVWAECLTNKGKYMPAILEALNDILSTKSWTFPAEDNNKTNFQGTLYTIGLSSAAYGHDMAQALYLLNSKLTNELKQQITDALYKKVFTPSLNAIKNNNANKESQWLTNGGNHNAVILSGVTGAALAVIKDKKERAVFVAIAERYSPNYITGYLDDGYCTEGMGYYTYGFGHYLLLREQLWQATGGKIDILKRPKIKEIAAFAPAMEIINGVYAAIGDCEQYIRPGRQVMYYINKNFGLGLKDYNSYSDEDIEQPALSNIMYFFPNSASLAKSVPSSNAKLSIRNYFKISGVLTVRPFPESTLNMGATFKGGNNNEEHNHNDIGSFTIAMGDEILMGDPGLATYTPKYWGTQRYVTYKTTASYGHPVPLVAGTQQRFGKEAQAKIIGTKFTDQKDVFVMDLISGYEVPSLKKLTRSFTYDRTKNGYIEVKDEYTFDQNQSFETALIIRGKWKQLSANQIEITGKKQRMLVQIQASSSSFTVTGEEIIESPIPYTRIAVRLKDATKTGSVVMTFKPAKLN